jgi:hypothetical protein
MEYLNGSGLPPFLPKYPVFVIAKGKELILVYVKQLKSHTIDPLPSQGNTSIAVACAVFGIVSHVETQDDCDSNVCSLLNITFISGGRANCEALGKIY